MDKYATRCTVAKVPFLSTLTVKNAEGKKRLSIRAWRLMTIALVHILFVLSYRADIQILEGDISGSRILGFHLTDAFMSFQVFAATHEFPTNLIIGTATILLFYALVGGRAFCGWVCPYTFWARSARKSTKI